MSELLKLINETEATVVAHDHTIAKPNTNFSLMKNILDKNTVSATDVSDYLSAAHDSNDGVDTVTFGLETDDGQIVKVFVNVNDADAFEAAMAGMLGKEDNIEKAIDKLAKTYDIVDVEWPGEVDAANAAETENAISSVDDANEEPQDTTDIDLEAGAAAAEVTADDDKEEEEEEEKDKKDDKKKDEVDDLDLDSEPSDDLDLDSEPEADDSEEDLTDKEDDTEEPAADEEPTDEEPAGDDEEDLADKEDDTEDEKKAKAKKRDAKKKKEETKTTDKKLEQIEREERMSTIGQRFKNRVLKESVKTDDEDNDTFELTGDEKELEDLMTGVNSKKLLQLIILLKMPVEILGLRKTTLRQNLRLVGREMTKNASMRLWVSALLKELIAYEQSIQIRKLKTTTVSDSRHAENEDIVEEALATVADQLTNKTQTTLYNVLIGLGVPEILMTMKKSQLKMALRSMAIQLNKKARQKAYLNNLARAMGKDTEAVDASLSEAINKNKGEKIVDVGDEQVDDEVVIDEPTITTRKKNAEISAADLGNWAISKFGDDGMILAVANFTVKLPNSSAEKLVDAFAEGDAINVKGIGSARYGFKPINRGKQYTVRKIGDNKYPDGVILPKKSIDLLIDFIGDNT